MNAIPLGCEHMKRIEKIEKLASEILLHKKRYYTGQATVSDDVYDALEDELRSLEPSHPVLSFVGYSLSESSGKVEHKPPMLSLQKTYEVEDVLSFVTQAQCLCLDKLDGMAMSLEYRADGSLFKASTRGNGTFGEDVTESIFHIGQIPKKISLPLLDSECVVEVRGEVYFPISEFPAFEAEFDSYRNAVPGTFGRKEIEEAIPVLRVLGFAAYEVFVRKGQQVLGLREVARSLGLPKASFMSRLRFLDSLGFQTGLAQEVVEFVVNPSRESVSNLIQVRFARKRDYQIDGLVFRIDDDVVWEAMGSTAHHPRGSLAFKQTGETAVTEILAIEESMGRSGKVTFRARLSPVFLSGATISYATLHNAEFIEAGGYAPGAKVRIKRSGEVIPAIIGLEEEAPAPYQLPEKCPCGVALMRRGPDLFCTERKSCVYRDRESLVYFVQQLEIMGISDKIVNRLLESGLVREPADFFKIQRNDVLNLEGFAEKSAENLVAAIQARRQLPLAIFLTALGISRGGIVKCKEVARHFVTLDAVLAATVPDYELLKGWARKSAEEFSTSLSDKRGIVENLLRVVDVLPDHSAASMAQTVHPLKGKAICITGALSRPREEYRELMEGIGAKLVDSVSAKTQFLVCNEPSSSSKYVKAQTLGIPIITEDQLMAQLTEGASEN
jgi:DNA ligase (NAD+)